MLQLSVIPGKEVKPKSGKNVAFPDPGNLQLEGQSSEPFPKPSSEQDLQRRVSGDPDAFELMFDLGVLDARYDRKSVSLTARYILGIIAAYVGYGSWGYLSQNKMAQAARCSRLRVLRAVNEAEEAGYLAVNRRDKCNRYHVCEWVEHLAKTWVNPVLVRDYGLSISQAAFVSYIKFRQGDNGATWARHRETAEVLGVSYHSVARAAAWSAALGYVQIRHKPWRRSSKNEYVLTCLGEIATGVSESKSARPKRSALGQTNMEGELLNANSVRRSFERTGFGLSFDSSLDLGALYMLCFIQL